ncbi:MAG TPA: hypothetical protein VG734_11685 [Lacunisphaera sp.]|nr:hypothetical protein [Lacunisphaera sp.]
MVENDQRIRRRVWVGLAVGCAGVGAWLVWNRMHPMSPAREAGLAEPFVQVVGAGQAGGDQVLREKAEIMDPTPLFFPTAWNFGQQPLPPGSLKQPGQVFPSFEPQYPLITKGIGADDNELQGVPTKLADLLAQGNEAPFAGMGRVDRERSTLPVRAAYLEVRALENADNIISEQLGGATPPRADIAPIEFIVLVGSAGLVGEPFLTTGSGRDEVDNYFRNYLVKTYRLGEHLPPGQYRVVVGS